MIPVILQDLNLYKNHFYLLPDNSVFNALAKFEQLRDASFSETDDHTFIVYRTLAFLDQLNQNKHIQNYLLDQSLDKSIAYINEHYESKISIKQLAAICNLSRNALRQNTEKPRTNLFLNGVSQKQHII
jgi:YesN/AraC family two-component response regulator